GTAVDEQAWLSGDQLSVAARRHRLLSAIIQDDPGAVLRAAMPAELRASLPVAVQAYVEEEMDVEGELEVLHEDRDDDSRYLHFLKVKDERFSLHFAAHPPMLQTGSRVRVRGIRVEGALALESGSASVESLSSVLPNSFGEQRTVVILVNFQDKPTEQPYTRDHARDVVLGTANQFYAEASYQQTSLSGDVFGWLTIPMNSTVCDGWALADHTKAAATAAGVNLSAYTRYVYAFPGNACTWWGTGTVGGNPSQAWINGTLVFQVVGHEMGHNFGLFHSRSIDCGSTTLGTNCTRDEYGDSLDTMGYSTGHYNAFQKERLGWLNYGTSPPITTVQADGTYSLEPYETAGSNPKALKILKDTDAATGKKTWYYVEFRQAIGFDSFLSGNSNVLNGVVIHTGSELNDNSSDLLDMTPTTASSSDPALAVGKSFNDPDAEVTIEAVWASNSNASVRVTFGTPTCVPSNPTVAFSPSLSQSVPAGTPVTYTVLVTNNDNTACAASSFTLQATAPTGWSSTFTSSTLAAGPGASVSTALQITSPVSATPGTYPIGVTAGSSANAGFSASASATLQVAGPLTVGVSTDQSSYLPRQSVFITANVSDNGLPINRAKVTFTVTKPNGTEVTKTISTRISGAAIYKFRLRSLDPVGVYQVRADANLNNTRFGGAATSFTAQEGEKGGRGGLRPGIDPGLIRKPPRFYARGLSFVITI
ncbi:MAG: NEW3 domain-containing protein, partial [Candidatus Methylomirabilis sp.]